MDDPYAKFVQARDDDPYANLQQPKRSLPQRFGDDVMDAALRNPTVSAARSRIFNPWQDFDPTRFSRFDPPTLVDVIPGMKLGIDGAGLLANFLTPGAVRRARAAERDRRARFAEASKSDPFYKAEGGLPGKAAHGAAALLATVAGAAVDPANLIAPGRTVVGRIAGQGALNAANNAETQGADINAGLQQDFDPGQVATAGLVGLALGGLAEAIPGLAPAVRRAFLRAKVEPEAVAAPAAGEVGAADATMGGPAVPEPLKPLPFVKPLEKRGLLADLGKAVEDSGVPQVAARALGRLYTGALSYRHPLEQAVEQLRTGIEAERGAPKDIKPSQDPRKLASVGTDVFNIGHTDLVSGVHGYQSLTPESPALHDVISATAIDAEKSGKKAADGLALLNSYLAAKRGVEEWGRFERGEIPNEPLPAKAGGDKASLEAYVARVEAEHPDFVEHGADMSAIGQALWKKQLDAGLISQEVYDAALKARSFYVPLRRVMDESAPGVRASPANKASVAKQFRGSERDVLGPVEMTALNTYEVNRRIRQNDINLGLVRMAEELDKLLQRGDPEARNGLLRKLDRPTKAIQVSRDELGRLANRNAPPDVLDAMFADEGNYLYRPGEINEGGRPIIYVWRDGKPEAWEIVDKELGRDLYNSMTGMARDQADLLTSFLRAPATLIRKGVITHPAFLFANFIRDQMANFVLNPDGFLPGEGVTGVGRELFGSETSRLYGLSGGVSGGKATAGLRDVIAHHDVLALRQMGLRAKYAKDLGSVFNVPEIAETGTRLAVFKRAFDRAKADGMSDIDALVEAQHTARDALDFGRFGSRMLTAIRIIPFLNAAMQGMDKLVRTAVPAGAVGRAGIAEALRPLFGRDFANPIRKEDARAIQTAYKVWAKLGAASVFSLGLAALYKDDPEYQNIPEYIRASNWLFKVNGTWVAVPKPFEMAVPMTIAERGFEAAYFDDPTAWARMARGVAQNVALPNDNPFLRTSVELAANKNFLTGGQIVPDQKTTMLPQDQSRAYTSAFSKWLGAHLALPGPDGKIHHVAPADIDHAIVGFGGSWGQSILRYSNWTDPERPETSVPDATLSRRFFPQWQRGAQDSSNFFDRVGSRTAELQQRLNSMVDRIKAGRPGEADALLRQADEPGRFWIMTQLAGRQDVNGELTSGGGVDKLHPLNRAKAVVTNAGRMINELYGERPRDQNMQPVDDRVWRPDRMSPREKAQVQDLLDQYEVAETRNAMIVSRQPGYENRKPMSIPHMRAQLDALDPAIMQELDRRLSTGQDRAYSAEAVSRLWPQVEARLRHDGAHADLTDLVVEAATSR